MAREAKRCSDDEEVVCDNSLGWITCLLVVLSVCFRESTAQKPGDFGAAPLDVALSLRGHNSRSPINLSPDGEWIAHTVQTDENVPRDGVAISYSPTGFPFSEGDSRMEATLTNVRTGEVIRLGGARSASWAAVWSPDGILVSHQGDT
jgi:hypothetical protein